MTESIHPKVAAKRPQATPRPSSKLNELLDGASHVAPEAASGIS
jgi:hypothetical protein